MTWREAAGREKEWTNVCECVCVWIKSSTMLSLVVMPLSNLCSRSVAEKRLMGLLGRLQWINTGERLRGSRQTSGPHISSTKKKKCTNYHGDAHKNWRHFTKSLNGTVDDSSSLHNSLWLRQFKEL